ncbi:26S protease regulatory subunit 8 [Cichlidogyrus casuarinus]|uniref:26S proteasome regulatory subunit 8 n=1 Tax=Cichlidogyrus casuarinus TaxID=1844966 RepID=A0ABD2QN51_9PLAT
MSLFSGSTFGGGQQIPTTTTSTGFNLGGGVGSKPTFGTSGSLFGSSAATAAAINTGTNSLFGSTPTTGLSFSNSSQPTNQSSLSFAAPKTTQSNISFGSTQSNLSFGLPKPATTTSSGGLSFGTAVTSTTSSFGSTTAPTATTITPGLSFGSLATTTPSSGLSLRAPANTTAPSSIFGSTSLSQSAATTTASPLTSSLNFSAPTTTTSGLNLAGSIGTTSLPFGTSAIPTTQPAAGLSFALSTSKSATPATTGGLSFSLPSATTTTVATTGSTAAPAKQLAILTYQQLEDMVNKWTLELEEQERFFMKETSKLNHWDKVLVDNADKINELQTKMNDAEAEQKRIQQELEFIESQQRELESILEPLENSTKDFTPSQQHVDAEREAIFQMAISADFELGQMLMDLQHLAGKVNNATSVLSGDQSSNIRVMQASENSLTAGTKSSTEIIPQLTKILNAHMHSLNWIHNNTLRAARFNADGQYCMTAGGDKTIKLWNPYNGLLLKTYNGHGSEVSDVQASQDNSQLASGGADCVVVLWDVATGQSLRRWRKHPGRVNAVRFAGPTLEMSTPGVPGGSSMLLSCGVDGMVLAWDTRSKAPYPIQRMHEAKDSVTCIVVNRFQIITGSVDRYVRTYDLRRGLMLEDFVGYPITSVDITVDDQCLLVACQDSTIRLFDASNGELLNKFQGHKNEAFHLDACLFNQGSLVASGSEDTISKEVLFWDLIKSEEPLHRLSHGPQSQCWNANLNSEALPPSPVYLSSTHFINSVSSHPDGNGKLLTGGGDYVWLWGPAEVLQTESFIGPQMSLVCGDVKGNLKVLFNRLTKIFKNAGQFESLFCVGDFFGPDLSQIKQLIDKQIEAPLPIFVVSPLPDNAKELICDPDGCQIAENVKFLGNKGLYTTLSGFKIVYAVINEANSSSTSELHLSSMKPTESFTGVDMLITTQWPIGYSNFLDSCHPSLPANEVCDLAVSRLTYVMKPRYHFASGHDVYFERRPYRNHKVLAEKNIHITRFIGLASIKNLKNEKYIYALKMIPMSKMSHEELNSQPGDVTDNPYTEVIFNSLKAKESHAQTEANQYFYDIKSNAGKKRRHEENNDARKQLADQCWFCLGNPKVEKHLIVCIGTQVYLALPRGPLIDEHVLILTVGHHQSYVMCPEAVRMEIDSFKEALREYFKSKNMLMVCFERNFKTQHFQLQCVPIPFSLGASVKNVFVHKSQTDEDSPCELMPLPKNATLEDICPPRIPYLVVDLPNGERLFNNIEKNRLRNANIQFGRQEVESLPRASTKLITGDISKPLKKEIGKPSEVATEKNVDGINEYYASKINELEYVVAHNLKNLRRLEAQRNELNAKVRMLRDELQLLQEQGSYVGEVVKPMDKKKVLVKVQPEGKYVVDLDKNIDIATVTPNARVALRNDSYTLHKILPSKVDPLVSLMMVEKVPDSTYEMIGGLDKQIKEIKEVIELPVKHPELFEALGIAQPKGVLLYGPPGTGKTLLARAVAHHTECTFIRVSGSELVQKFIGEGARMVRELFVMAREHAPSIIFMDEVDSIGSTRLEGSSGGDSEVQRTMLELLNQLDGFEPKQNIKVIMATNRIDILDSALLRPGRIDRKIEFPAPNEEARLDILKIHSRKMNLTRGIDLRKIAEQMPGASGAEVKSVCTEAGMYALRERRVHVTQEDFELSVAKVMQKDSDKSISIKKLWK